MTKKIMLTLALIAASSATLVLAESMQAVDHAYDDTAVSYAPENNENGFTEEEASDETEEMDADAGEEFNDEEFDIEALMKKLQEENPELLAQLQAAEAEANSGNGLEEEEEEEESEDAEEEGEDAELESEVESDSDTEDDEVDGE